MDHKVWPCSDSHEPFNRSVVTCIWNHCWPQSHTDTHTHTHTHIRFTALWTLSGIARVSRYQNQSGFDWSKRQWVAVATDDVIKQLATARLVGPTVEETVYSIGATKRRYRLQVSSRTTTQAYVVGYIWHVNDLFLIICYNGLPQPASQ